MDIFPEERGVKMDGYYILKNKSNRNVDSVIVTLSPSIHINEFKFDRAATKVIDDSGNGFYVYKLASPLKPGDSLRLNMSIDHYPNGFKSTDAGTAVVYNGTFFSSEFRSLCKI